MSPCQLVLLGGGCQAPFHVLVRCSRLWGGAILPSHLDAPLDGRWRSPDWGLVFWMPFWGSWGDISSCSTYPIFFFLSLHGTQEQVSRCSQRYTGPFGERPPQTGLAFPREPFVPPSFRGPAKQASFVDIVSLPSSTLGRRGAYSLGLGPLARCHSRNVTLGYSRYEAGRLGSRFPRFVPVVAHTHTHIPIGPFPRILFLLSLVRESVP